MRYMFIMLSSIVEVHRHNRSLQIVCSCSLCCPVLWKCTDAIWSLQIVCYMFIMLSSIVEVHKHNRSLQIVCYMFIMLSSIVEVHKHNRESTNRALHVHYVAQYCGSAQTQ